VYCARCGCSEEREREYQAFDPAALAENIRENWMQGKVIDVSLSLLILVHV